MATALIVLAAGKGTRMHSDRPKVLHEVAGAPLRWHALRSGAALEPGRIVVVTGHGADEVEAAATAWSPVVDCVRQAEQLGTGHAVARAREALAGFEGEAVVLYGDTPFIRPETLEAMVAARAEADVVVLGFEAADPGRYGRLVVREGALERIVEFKETSDGRYLITLRGLIRFSVASELPETRGYRLVEPCFERYARDLECEPALIDREALLSALEVYFACNGIEGNWETIRETSDEKRVTALAMVCPFEPSEKQALLECETLTERARTMTQIMGMAVLDAGGIDPAKH